MTKPFSVVLILTALLMLTGCNNSSSSSRSSNNSASLPDVTDTLSAGGSQSSPQQLALGRVYRMKGSENDIYYLDVPAGIYTLYFKSLNFSNAVPGSELDVFLSIWDEDDEEYVEFGEFTLTPGFNSSGDILLRIMIEADESVRIEFEDYDFAAETTAQYDLLLETTALPTMGSSLWNGAWQTVDEGVGAGTICDDWYEEEDIELRVSGSDLFMRDDPSYPWVWLQPFSVNGNQVSIDFQQSFSYQAGGTTYTAEYTGNASGTTDGNGFTISGTQTVKVQAGSTVVEDCTYTTTLTGT